MIIPFLAAAFTFTASATGVEKAVPVEFLFIGRDSDKAYEAMFVLDMPLDDFAAGLEKAGFPRGKPLEPAKCRVWPVGATVSIDPPMSRFVETDSTGGFVPSPFVYTGGLRDSDGRPTAAKEMPASACALYSLSDSLIVPDGIHNQGDVYGRFKCLQTLKKGARYAFTISCDPLTTPREMRIKIAPGTAKTAIEKIRKSAADGQLDVQVTFDGELAVSEAVSAAEAINVLDSTRVRFNGCESGTLFYRAFLPLVKWRDRKNRITQPFELTIGESSEQLVFIDEDWSAPGDDPKLSPTVISFDEALKKEKTDTAFIYVSQQTRLSRVYAAMKRLEGSHVRNWYVFTCNPPSLHNPPYAQ